MKEFEGREEHQEGGSVGVWLGGVERMVADWSALVKEQKLCLTGWGSLSP